MLFFVFAARWTEHCAGFSGDIFDPGLAIMNLLFGLRWWKIGERGVVQGVAANLETIAEKTN